MTGEPFQIGPGLQRLVTDLLETIEPLLRAAASGTASNTKPGHCQQVWCPVCATAALAAGEQHPLITLVAEHSTPLIAVLLAMVNHEETPPPTAAATSTDDTASGHRDQPRYQHIDITVVEE
ncbi:hypothetical protein BH10ACT9_BH10ACT9_45890 [soil metagenome]